MKRTLLVVAAVVGFATAASAATLTVFTTTDSNTVSNTFLVGDTILLKVTGDATGGVDDFVLGGVRWNPAVATQVGLATQGNWLPVQGSLPGGAGFSYFMNQESGTHQLQGPITPIDTSVVTMIATQVGTSNVTFNVGSLLHFFGIYNTPAPTGVVHSFTVIVPEPATAGLIGLGLLGLVFAAGRARPKAPVVVRSPGARRSVDR